MSNFSIGLSGLEVAQRAMELIGTNLANAGTEGYHKQEAIISPLSLYTCNGVSIGGAEITEVRRAVSDLLEMEITRQQTAMGQADEELAVLEMVESAFGTVGSGGLDEALGRFFDALTELASDPVDVNLVLRKQAVSAADALAGQFRHTADFFRDVQQDLRLQIQEYVTEANRLTAEIADLNQEITVTTIRGGGANLLCDRRDRAILELADLVPVDARTQSGVTESISVSAWGITLVTGSSSVPLEVSQTTDGQLGVMAEGASFYRTGVTGGRMGGLIFLCNDTLAGISGSLDTLASEIITGINQLHAQGVGLTGSFTELTGVAVPTGTLASWPNSVTSGSFYVRVTETATGDVNRYEIAVDPDMDTITDIRDSLDLVDGLSASIVASALKISADSGYTFDFLPALSAEPYTTTIPGGGAEPTISGIYTGDANQVFTCTVVGSGGVGIASDLALEVRDGSGELVATFNIGQGYAAGQPLDVGSGINVALGAGPLNDGEEFTIQALADTDSSGFLAAAGMNTLFSGSSALSMALREDVRSDLGRVATAASASGNDNANIDRMLEIGRQGVAGLGGVTPQEYYHQLVTGVGQAVVIREARKTNLDSIMRQLGTQRDEISRVDMNEEVAKLVVFERMYQAMAKVISVQDSALQTLFDLV